MDFLFCCYPNRIREVDPDYQAEADCVRQLSSSVSLLDHDALLEGSVSKSIRGVESRTDQKQLCYRGWMIPPPLYKQLYEGLLEKNLVLINSPQQYQHCHYLPDSYESIKGKTPETVWIPGRPPFDPAQIMAAIKLFGGKPLVLKDYVKSQKHYWKEACYIPDSNKQDEVMSRVNRFIELQCDDIEGGLVFRAYVPIKIIGRHAVSGMPLSHEYRVVWFEQNPVVVWPYWDAADPRECDPPLDAFREVANQINSRFFTMDIAELDDSSWIIVELGDAQVAGLPENADPVTLYKPLID